MELNKTINKINSDREKVEACFVFSLWKNPELFDDYKDVNTSNGCKLESEDAQFYFNLGKAMRKQGLNSFDNISTVAFLADKPNIEKKFNDYGGWNEVKELMTLVNEDNVLAYYDEIAKRNSLVMLASKYDEIFNDVDRFKKASNEEIYETFDLLNASVSLSTGREAQIEQVIITEKDLQEFDSGEAVGLSYAKGAPLLNYTTLGLPVGDIYLLAGHSGAGKSSFAFENMVIPLAEGGTPVCVLSNEMQIKAYKNMLISHILTKRLNYWKLTRKKIKIGGFNDEEMDMLHQAAEISRKEYGNIYFVKLFDNDGSIVMKHMKKANRQFGVEAFVWDTYKADDMSKEIWQELLMSSRKVFNLISKEQWSLVCTFQLALYTTNQRYLDASCLSSSKQIKEVVSELVMMRKLWQDEYTGEKFDCKPYRFNKDNKKIKETIELDPEKTYVVCIVDKTRNDENAKNILFQWDSSWNSWRELGFCTIVNDHRGGN